MPTPQPPAFFAGFLSLMVFLQWYVARVLELVPDSRLTREQVLDVAKSMCYPPAHKLIKLLKPFD